MIDFSIGEPDHLPEAAWGLLLPETGTQAAHLGTMRFFTVTGRRYLFWAGMSTLVTVLSDPPLALSIDLPTADGQTDKPNVDPAPRLSNRLRTELAPNEKT